MKKHILIFIASIILLLAFFETVSVIKCEIITKKHGDEFLMISEIKTASQFKILTYTNRFARVYCINYDKSNGNVYDFIKKDRTWVYDKWEDIGWSISGTADKIIWPYWWHFFYSHPLLT